MKEYTVQNAIIESYSIDINDHGSLDLWLHLNYGNGLQQGFGGWVLYLPRSFTHHSVQSPAGHYIYQRAAGHTGKHCDHKRHRL